MHYFCRHTGYVLLITSLFPWACTKSRWNAEQAAMVAADRLNKTIDPHTQEEKPVPVMQEISDISFNVENLLQRSWLLDCINRKMVQFVWMVFQQTRLPLTGSAVILLMSRRQPSYYPIQSEIICYLVRITTSFQQMKISGRYWMPAVVVLFRICYLA